jgi:vacuolar-type H+-ATPase subunit F/Vma7
MNPDHKFTPGPYNAKLKPEVGHLILESDADCLDHTIWAGMRRIATVYRQAPGDDANVNLLTAAPDLLEALEAIRARINGEYDLPALLRFGHLSVNPLEDIEEIAAKAIAKALGQSQEG